MRTLFIKDNFECHFVNLLSFTQQLFSSQLEMNHVIQQPMKQAIAKYNEKKIKKNNVFGPRIVWKQCFCP